MTAILASDVFPGLDKNDPLDSKDEDKIPDKFRTDVQKENVEKEEIKNQMLELSQEME